LTRVMDSTYSLARIKILFVDKPTRSKNRQPAITIHNIKEDGNA
jgi:hypothetical protein